jgi:hypothetical protein
MVGLQQGCDLWLYAVDYCGRQDVVGVAVPEVCSAPVHYEHVVVYGMLDLGFQHLRQAVAGYAHVPADKVQRFGFYADLDYEGKMRVEPHTRVLLSGDREHLCSSWISFTVELRIQTAFRFEVGVEKI